MENFPIVPEGDVILSVATFLLSRSVFPYQFSIPKGKNLDTEKYKNLLREAYGNVGSKLNFSNSGPDICAVSETEWWLVECKGAGKGKKQTQRNNFDRALASVVCHYREDTEELPEKYRAAKPVLGLALPNSPEYLNELENRISQSLRKVINLWILLYDPFADGIIPVKPTEKFEFK